MIEDRLRESCPVYTPSTSVTIAPIDICMYFQTALEYVFSPKSSDNDATRSASASSLAA